MLAMPKEVVNAHKAQMFDAIRDFFIALTSLTKIGAEAMKAQLELEAKRRKP
jgi:hypothetical protein